MGSSISSPDRQTIEPEPESELDDEQATLTPDRSEAEQEIEESVEDHAEDRGITDRQGKTIEERREGVEEILEDKLDIVESHQYGSHSRGTMTGPLDEESDADVMFVLGDEDRQKYMSGGKGARKVLRKVKRAIKDDPRYSDTEVRIDRNVVAIKYHDVTMEVTPAFQDGSGGYHIPDTYQEGRSWVRTNPRQYKNMFQASNQARGDRPKRLARLAKDYNDRSGKPVSSYHMEVMAYQYARTQPQDAPMDEIVDGFFERLPSKVRQGTKDPVYDNQRVDDGMDRETRREAVKKSKKARKHIRRARELKKQGKTEEAKEEYRKVLGDDFK